jgi:hypothetical protein
MGEPLAILPPIVAALPDLHAGIAAQQFGQGGMRRLHRQAQGFDGDAGADADRLALMFDLPADRPRRSGRSPCARSRNCLVTHRPTSVAPAISVASGWARPGRCQLVGGRGAASAGGRCPPSAAQKPPPGYLIKRRAVGGHPVGHRSGFGGLGRADDRRIAGAAAQVAGQHVVMVGAARSAWPRPSTRQSPACRSRIGCRDGRPSPAAPGCISPCGPASPSTVRTALPCSCGRNRMQAFSAFGPSASVTITVQAPQSPSLQPSLVPQPARFAQPVEKRPRRAFPHHADRRSVQQKRDPGHMLFRRGLPVEASCVPARCGVKRATRPFRSDHQAGRAGTRQAETSRMPAKALFGSAGKSRALSRRRPGC